MTCREKAKIEHPEMVGSEFHGGVANCPSVYGYLDRPDFCRGPNIYDCDRCWGREISEKDAPIQESNYQTVCDRCKSSGVCKYSDDLNTFLHGICDRFPFVTPDFKCEYFNERKENV